MLIDLYSREFRAFVAMRSPDKRCRPAGVYALHPAQRMMVRSIYRRVREIRDARDARVSAVALADIYAGYA